MVLRARTFASFGKGAVYFYSGGGYSEGGVNLAFSIEGEKESSLGTTELLAGQSSEKIYPNPLSKGLFNIVTDKKISSVHAVDASGKNLTPKLYNNEVDLTSYSKGVYILQINYKDGSNSIKKIIKN